MGGLILGEYCLQTPNGEEIRQLQEIDGELFILTASQMYRLLAMQEGFKMLPVHQFAEGGHA